MSQRRHSFGAPSQPQAVRAEHNDGAAGRRRGGSATSSAGAGGGGGVSPSSSSSHAQLPAVVPPSSALAYAAPLPSDHDFPPLTSREALPPPSHHGAHPNPHHYHGPQASPRHTNATTTAAAEPNGDDKQGEIVFVATSAAPAEEGEGAARAPTLDAAAQSSHQMTQNFHHIAAVASASLTSLPETGGGTTLPATTTTMAGAAACSTPRGQVVPSAASSFASTPIPQTPPLGPSGSNSNKFSSTLRYAAPEYRPLRGNSPTQVNSSVLSTPPASSAPASLFFAPAIEPLPAAVTPSGVFSTGGFVATTAPKPANNLSTVAPVGGSSPPPAPYLKTAVAPTASPLGPSFSGSTVATSTTMSPSSGSAVMPPSGSSFHHHSPPPSYATAAAASPPSTSPSTIVAGATAAAASPSGASTSSSSTNASSATSGVPWDFILVVDFEATCEEPTPPDFIPEIIEFPVVIIDVEKQRAVHEFHAYVRPVRNPVLTPFCTSLTGISQEQVDAAEPITTVVPRFLKWLEEVLPPTTVDASRCIFATDGPWDMADFMYRFTVVSAGHTALFPPMFYHFLDVKKSFADFFGSRRGKIQAMLDHLGMTFEGRLHSGLDDTRNIARIVLALLRRGCTFSTVCQVQTVTTADEKPRGPASVITTYTKFPTVVTGGTPNGSRERGQSNSNHSTPSRSTGGGNVGTASGAAAGASSTHHHSATYAHQLHLAMQQPLYQPVSTSSANGSSASVYPAGDRSGAYSGLPSAAAPSAQQPVVSAITSGSGGGTQHHAHIPSGEGSGNGAGTVRGPGRPRHDAPSLAAPSCDPLLDTVAGLTQQHPADAAADAPSHNGVASSDNAVPSPASNEPGHAPAHSGADDTTTTTANRSVVSSRSNVGATTSVATPPPQLATVTASSPPSGLNSNAAPHIPASMLAGVAGGWIATGASSSRGYHAQQTAAASGFSTQTTTGHYATTMNASASTNAAAGTAGMLTHALVMTTAPAAAQSSHFPLYAAAATSSTSTNGGSTMTAAVSGSVESVSAPTSQTSSRSSQRDVAGSIIHLRHPIGGHGAHLINGGMTGGGGTGAVAGSRLTTSASVGPPRQTPPRQEGIPVMLLPASARSGEQSPTPPQQQQQQQQEPHALAAVVPAAAATAADVAGAPLLMAARPGGGHGGGRGRMVWSSPPQSQHPS